MSRRLTLTALLLSSLALNVAGQDRLFVLNKAEGSVSVIDPSSARVERTIPVGIGPHEAAASPDGCRVVVCNYGDRSVLGNSLTVIDARSLTVEATIALGKFHRPHGLAWLPDGRRVVVTCEHNQAVIVVDIEEGAVVGSIKTDQKTSHMVALDGDGRRAYVANIASGSISVLDLEAMTLTKIIETGAGAEGIAAHPTKDEVWVTNRAADTVSIIDTKSLELIKSLPCAKFPIRVAFSPDGALALVSCARSGEVVVFDAATAKESSRVAMKATAAAGDIQGRVFGDALGEGPVPVGILIDPQGLRAYIANTYADQVTVLDLKTLEVSGALIGGKEPDGLAWSGSAVRRKAGKAWVPFLGNATCPISGEPVRRDCYAEQLGERLYACNRDCAKKLQADFDGWRARIYPANERRVVGNAHCPCMPDRKADPKFEVAFQGYRVGLCCWKCPARFLTAPRTHLTLALHPELTRVSNRTCPVKPGVDVAPDAFVVYQDRLIAVSAGVTPEDFNRDREAALKTLDGD